MGYVLHKECVIHIYNFGRFDLRQIYGRRILFPDFECTKIIMWCALKLLCVCKYLNCCFSSSASLLLLYTLIMIRILHELQAFTGSPLVQARNFAVMTGVNAGISCVMKRIRGVEDVQSR